MSERPYSIPSDCGLSILEVVVLQYAQCLIQFLVQKLSTDHQKYLFFWSIVQLKNGNFVVYGYALTDLIRVILPSWERNLPFHPCNLTFIHSSIEAKTSLLTLVLISGALRDFSELTI